MIITCKILYVIIVIYLSFVKIELLYFAYLFQSALFRLGMLLQFFRALAVCFCFV